MLLLTPIIRLKDDPAGGGDAPRRGGTPHFYIALSSLLHALRRSQSRFFMVLLIAASILFARTPADSSAALDDPDSRYSIVFVIDISTSMYDLIDELKEALKTYVRELEPGDSIAIVTFGTNAGLHYRRTIHTSSDIETVLKFCDELSCPEHCTYITAGLNVGVRELYQFYEANPSGMHELVLMSDGKNNPPRDVEEEVTYDEISERFFSRFEPGKDWYISYIALRGAADVQLKDFVEACRGTTLELHAEQDTEGGQTRIGLRDRLAISKAMILPGPGVQIEGDNVLLLGEAWVPLRVRIPLIVKPVKGSPKSRQIKVAAVLNETGEKARLLAGVWPAEITCSEEATEAEIRLSIDGAWDKGIQGMLQFTSLSGTILIVQPPHLEFRFEEPPKVKLHTGMYRPELDQSKWDPIDWLALGPLKAGEVSKQTLSIKLDGPLPQGLDIKAEPHINLPEGVTCKVEVGIGGYFEKEARLSVEARVEDNVELADGWHCDGNLVLTTAYPTISFSQNPIPLRAFAGRYVDAYNLRTKGGSYSKAMNLWGEIKEHWRWISVFVLGPTALVSLALSAGFLRYRAYMRKLVPLEGWLIALEAPPGRNIKNIDLNRMSQESKKSVLSLGRAPASDISLSHESVDKQHAQLRSGREGNPTPVHLKSVGLNDVKVNGHVIDEEITLQDRDTIEIGAFQFIFSNSHLKQVVVHYKDGDVKYGIPLTWNIEEEGFVLRPEGKGAGEMQMYIPFRELKGVFFVKDFDKEIARKMKLSYIFAKKDRVIVEFMDGEKIDGYTVQDYTQDSARFFIVPKVDTGKEENNTCILIERSFAKKIDMLEKNAEP